MDISVVIVNWNVRERLTKCLESLYHFTHSVVFEVFVVDNHSDDGSVAMLHHDFPQVQVIALTENKGFSAGNNEGIKRARGRYVLLLNPDTELEDNALKEMAGFMDAYPQASALAPRLLYPDGKVQLSCRHFPSLLIDLWESLHLDHIFPRSNVFNRYRMGMWEHDELREVEQPYGACLLLRRHVFNLIGLMDERFFMYYDEVDLCYRLKKAGGKILFIPDIAIVHYANQSSNQALELCEYQKARSRYLFFTKHYGRWVGIVLLSNLIIRSMLVWFVFPLTHRLIGKPHAPDFFKEPVRFLWKGYKDALRSEPVEQPFVHH